MKKYTFNFSRIMVSALIATTLGTQANEDKQSSHQLVKLVTATHSHVKDLNRWCKKFLHSKETYPALIEEFKEHIDAFDNDVVTPVKQLAQIINNSSSRPDILATQAQELVTDVKDMLDEMHTELHKLIGSQKAPAYFTAFRALKVRMVKKFDLTEIKLEKIKASCTQQNATELLQGIKLVQTGLKSFKDSHENAEYAIVRRIGEWITQNAAVRY